MTSQQHIATMQTWMSEAINAGNLAVVDELAHPEYIYRNPTEELRGAEAIKGLFATYRTGFPDFQVHVDERVADDDRIAEAFTMTGTHRGEFMGIPATGKTIEVHGFVLSRFVDGKIVEEWEVIDQLTFLEQLGAVEQRDAS
jgi:steroid delta-isomerase-like uncharacterized protein